MGINKDNRNVFLILCFIIMSIIISFSIFKFVDPDILWHVKLGEDILQNGISSIDKFSWQEGLKWDSQEWLFDIIIYLVSTYLGNIGFIGLLFIAYFSVMYLAFKRNKDYKSILLFLLVISSRNLFPQNGFNRPSMFSSIFIVLLLWILLDENISHRYLKIGLISIFMANFHGGCLTTCLLLFTIVFAFDLLLRILKYKDETILARDCLSFLVFFICGFINPYTYKMYWLGLIGPMLNSNQSIDEWRSISFKPNEIIMIIVVLLLIISIVDSKEFKELERSSFLSLALTCALFIGGMMSKRGLMILSIFVIIFDYKYLEEFIFKYLGKINFNEKFIKILNKIKDMLLKYSFIILGTIFVLIIISNKDYFLLKNNNFEKYIEDKSNYSYKIINYIKDNLDEDDKLFNTYIAGNYLIFNDCKVFIDSRQHPYVPEFGDNSSFEDYLWIWMSYNYYDKFMEICDKYDIEYVFWSGEIDVGYDVYDDFKDDWDVVISDKVSKDDDSYQYNQYLFKRKGE